MQKIEQTLATSYHMNHKKLNSFNSHMNHKTHKNSKQVDGIVDRLVNTFHNEAYVPIFRKAGWYLSEATINNAVEASSKAGNPLAYFITCMKREFTKLSQ